MTSAPDLYFSVLIRLLSVYVRGLGSRSYGSARTINLSYRLRIRVPSTSFVLLHLFWFDNPSSTSTSRANITWLVIALHALSVCARDVAPSLAAVVMSRRFSRSKYLQSSVLVAVCLDGIENDNQYRGARQNTVKGMTATKGSSSSSLWLLPIQKTFCD